MRSLSRMPNVVQHGGNFQRLLDGIVQAFLFPYRLGKSKYFQRMVHQFRHPQLYAAISPIMRPTSIVLPPFFI